MTTKNYSVTSYEVGKGHSFDFDTLEQALDFAKTSCFKLREDFSIIDFDDNGDGVEVIIVKYDKDNNDIDIRDLR